MFKWLLGPVLRKRNRLALLAGGIRRQHQCQRLDIILGTTGRNRAIVYRVDKVFQELAGGIGKDIERVTGNFPGLLAIVLKRPTAQ